MKHLILTTALICGLTTTVHAESAVNQIREHSIAPINVLPCTVKPETDVGLCALFHIDGADYVVFARNRAIQFIRKILPEGGYKQVYTLGEVDA